MIAEISFYQYLSEMKKTIFLLGLCIVVFACKQTTNSTKNSVTETSFNGDSLTTILDSIYNESAIVGFSTAIVSSNKILYSKSFGKAGLSEEKIYTPQTLQNIGSISKTFIGVSLLKAQELGLLKLDDPINQYLPFSVINPEYPNSEITIRQLATHTSSIVDTDYYGKSYILLNENHQPFEKVVEYVNKLDTKIPMETYLEKVVGENGEWNTESFTDHAPGTNYEYTNIGATVAALVLEKAAKMPFHDFTKKYILDPLDMHSSGWLQSEIDASNRSRSFINKDTLIAPYELITYPDGGFITSTQELSLYLQELINGYEGNGTLLNKQSYQELFTKQLLEEQLPENEKGHNSGIFMGFSKRGIGHSGGDPGVLTFMYFNPETEVGKILFCNTDFEENQKVIKDFVAIWRTLQRFETGFQNAEAN